MEFEVCIAANKNISTDQSGNSITESGELPRLKDAALVERLLNDDLKDQLKQKLFRSSNTTDVSTTVIERNACGILFFNTIVNTNKSDLTSAALLDSALDERKDDAPFLSALNILASSAEIMAIIWVRLNTANGHVYRPLDITPGVPVINLPPARRSTRPPAHPLIGVESSNASTITEHSGPPDHAGATVTDPEGSLETTKPHKAIDDKNTGMSPILLVSCCAD